MSRAPRRFIIPRDFWSAERDLELRRRWRVGDKVREIAADFRCSEASVSARAAYIGLPGRKASHRTGRAVVRANRSPEELAAALAAACPPRALKPRTFDWSPARDATLTRLWTMNTAPCDIGAAVGTTATEVKARAAELGLAPFGAPRPRPPKPPATCTYAELSTHRDPVTGFRVLTVCGAPGSALCRRHAPRATPIGKGLLGRSSEVVYANGRVR